MKYRRFTYHSAGFTLIELMVVLAIMTTAYSLVGPNIIRTYDKVKAQSEIVELKETLKKISYKAFINAREVEVKFIGNKMQYHYRHLPESKLSQPNNEMNFDFIYFPTQELNFTSVGFTDLTELSIKVSDELKTVALNEINTL